MNAVEYGLLNGLRTAGPDRLALASASETLTYGALAARVAQFAAGLEAEGVRTGDRVALLMHDTPDLVALHQAAMAMGGVAVAVSSRASEEDLQRILAIVRPAAVAFDPAFEVRIRAALPASTPTRLLRSDVTLPAWKAAPARDLKPVPRRLTDPAFWVMTSGTTGQPKAVEHVHGNVTICADYYREALGCTPGDRLFATSRFHFAYAIGNAFAALRMGATNVLLEDWATAQSVADTAERFGATVLLSVPALYHRLLEEGYAQGNGMRGLRHFVSAGERTQPQIWAAWEAASGKPILDGLGCSELVYMVIGNTPAARRPGSSGRAMPGVELRLVDEAGAAVSDPGVSGRLEVLMSSVCGGYRSVAPAPGAPPERPDDRFRPDGWFATGDEYAFDDDGFWHHRGRSGDMLRVSGLWVSPSEVEDALGGIPEIAETAAVLGESDIGLAEIVLGLVLTPGADAEAAVRTARARLEAMLPPYKRPRRFEVLDALPRTATGKVQRHKLRDAFRKS
jgi:3-hydroxybenzoate/4-hydroxybenzoate---CoA ligase